MAQGRGLVHVAVLALLLSTFLDATHAVQWIVGGDAKWSYLHANSAPTFYNDWAAGNTFSTGDTLLFEYDNTRHPFPVVDTEPCLDVFEYDNTTHTVLQLATESDFLACNLKASITKWTTGYDTVFISKAGTYYYVCGAPSHCEQGMKFSITATGNYVAAPPGTSNGTGAVAPTASLASPSTAKLYSGAAIVAMSLAATLAVSVV